MSPIGPVPAQALGKYRWQQIQCLARHGERTPFMTKECQCWLNRALHAYYACICYILIWPDDMCVCSFDDSL